jgi:polar amino acid transport system substrate-binding protein
MARSTAANRTFAPRIVALTSALALALLTLGGCAGPTPVNSGTAMDRDNPLRVGVTPLYPPVIFKEGKGYGGIEADLAQLVSRDLGRPVTYVELARDDLIPAILRGDIDVVMSGMSVTPERSKRVRFTEPYMDTGQLAAVRTKDLTHFGQPHQLRAAGVRIGFVRETTGAKFVSSDLPRSIQLEFEGADEGIVALRAGEIDVFIHDAPTIWKYTLAPDNRDLAGLYRALTKEGLAWAVGPNNSVLHSQLNESLAGLEASGHLEPVLRKWIPIRIQVAP